MVSLLPCWHASCSTLFPFYAMMKDSYIHIVPLLRAESFCDEEGHNIHVVPNRGECECVSPFLCVMERLRALLCFWRECLRRCPQEETRLRYNRKGRQSEKRFVRPSHEGIACNAYRALGIHGVIIHQAPSDPVAIIPLSTIRDFRIGHC